METMQGNYRDLRAFCGGAGASPATHVLPMYAPICLDTTHLTRINPVFFMCGLLLSHVALKILAEALISLQTKLAVTLLVFSLLFLLLVFDQLLRGETP